MVWSSSGVLGVFAAICLGSDAPIVPTAAAHPDVWSATIECVLIAWTRVSVCGSDRGCARGSIDWQDVRVWVLAYGICADAVTMPDAHITSLKRASASLRCFRDAIFDSDTDIACVDPSVCTRRPAQYYAALWYCELGASWY
eukprot:526908-Rhodomonas_salina.2